MKLEATAERRQQMPGNETLFLVYFSILTVMAVALFLCMIIIMKGKMLRIGFYIIAVGMTLTLQALAFKVPHIIMPVIGYTLMLVGIFITLMDKKQQTAA